MSAGLYSACGVEVSGSVKCVGATSHGQLDPPDLVTPIFVPVTFGGSQTYGSSSPTFTASTTAVGVPLTGTPTCAAVRPGNRPITPTLPAGTYTLGDCQGVDVPAGYVPGFTGLPTGFTVSKAAQAISFSGPGTATAGGTAALQATGGGSGNPVTFAVDPASGTGVCSVAGTTATFLAAGTCVIDANQAGGANYDAAPTVTRRVTVAAEPSGYDMVGSDGGVFVFPTGASGGFYGSLPALGVHVGNIVGMVPTADDQGYFLVGADGGVFAFGNAPYLGSLPGLHAAVGDIVGIVPTSNDQGYFLVGADGGVFTFGNAPFLGSLPGRGVSVSDIIGIAANPTDTGYWLVAATGTVYAFGAATAFGSAPATTSPVSAIQSTADGGGYWIVTQDGGVYPFGDAVQLGNLPALGVTPAHKVIGLVPTADGAGYWLIGSDGGIFAFGDAPFVGSLPGLGVSVTDVVGAVPTHP